MRTCCGRMVNFIRCVRNKLLKARAACRAVHIRCRAAAGRPQSLTLTLTLSLTLTLNLLNLTLSLKFKSVLTHRPIYAKWRHSSRDQSAA